MRKFINANEFPKSIAENLNEFLKTSHTIIPINVSENDYEYFKSFCDILYGYGYQIFTKYNKENLTVDFYAIKIKNFKNMPKDRYIVNNVPFKNQSIKLGYFSYDYYINVVNDKLLHKYYDAIQNKEILL